MSFSKLILGLAKQRDEAKAENARLRDQLQTLVNLQDGVDDGGDGITDDDWAATRAVLKGGGQ